VVGNALRFSVSNVGLLGHVTLAGGAGVTFESLGAPSDEELDARVCVQNGDSHDFVAVFDNITPGSEAVTVYSPRRSRCATRLVFPVYIYPSGGGLAAYGTAGAFMEGLKGRVDVVINPNNGNDALFVPNSDWVTALGSVQSAAGAYWDSGRTVFGYVYTQYGARAIADVKACIAGYYANGWNTNGGIFVDEVSAAPGDLAYYAELDAYMQANEFEGGLMLNTGVAGGAGPFSALSSVVAVVTCETDNLAAYTPNATQLADTDSSKYVGMANTLGGGSAAAVAAMKHLRGLRFGRVYVTNYANYNTLSDYALDMYTHVLE
jgi:hypothetical protein